MLPGNCFCGGYRVTLLCNAKIHNNMEIIYRDITTIRKNERKLSKQEYVDALKHEFTLPLPNNRRWDLDKDILPIFEKL